MENLYNGMVGMKSGDALMQVSPLAKE